MSYLVLARKWRPRGFDTLVGQEHVVRALTHALQEGRLHHAYLFTGTRGIGKTTIARILAKSLNCENGVTATPCGHCSACVEIDSGRFVDLLEVDAATNTRVDEMRQLLENAVYAPTRGRYKVYVIDEVHMLSNAAFNAMLKTLEEPPDHVKFILATTDPQKIPVTVLSRCLQFNLKQMPQQAIVDHLSHVLDAEAVQAEQGALRLIARAADGSMRDALSLLDQAIAHGAGRVVESEVRSMLGTVGDDFVFQLADILLVNDSSGLVDIARAMSARSLSFESALSGFCDLMVRVQTLQISPTSTLEDETERPRLERIAGAMHPEYVQLAYAIALQGREQLPYAPDHYSGFLMAMFRLHAFSSVSESDRAEKKSPLSSDIGSSGQKYLSRQHLPLQTLIEPSCIDGPPDLPLPPIFLGPNGAANSGREEIEAASPDWGGVITQLRLSGIVRELAQNSELVEFSVKRIVLCLSSAHRHLLAGPSRERLQQALQKLTGIARPVEVSLGAPRTETPAALVSRARQEIHDSAVEAIEGDLTIRELVEFLDASVSQGTIQQIANPLR